MITLYVFCRRFLSKQEPARKKITTVSEETNKEKDQKKESGHAVSRYAITSLSVSPLRVLPTTQETYEKSVFHPILSPF